MKVKCTLHAKVDRFAKDGFAYSVFDHEDMASCGYTALDTVEVEFTMPPHDVLVNGLVAAFRAEQQRIRAEMQQRVNALEEQIQKLLGQVTG